MKIACVGKGGSGKSTLSALLIRHLQSAGRDVLAIDADINMNLAGLLGVDFPHDRDLSRPENAAALRRHLRGTNTLIRDEHSFAPTTPPGPGSNLVAGTADPALAPFSVRGENLTLLTVGTYEADGIGQSCYHSNLFVAENLLSHTRANAESPVVADMVAGTDAFSYSMHLQFDAIFLIAEPTPESAEVCALYTHLAREAGMDGLVHVIANKVADDDDLSFIRARTGKIPIGAIPAIPMLKKLRQRGEALPAALSADPAIAPALQAMVETASHPAITPAARHGLLRALHMKLSRKDWIIKACGNDVANQFDMGKAA